MIEYCDKIKSALSNPHIDDNIDEIIPGLYMGSLKAAIKRDKLLELGVTHIVCAVNDVGV